MYFTLVSNTHVFAFLFVSWILYIYCSCWKYHFCSLESFLDDFIGSFFFSYHALPKYRKLLTLSMISPFISYSSCLLEFILNYLVIPPFICSPIFLFSTSRILLLLQFHCTYMGKNTLVISKVYILSSLFLNSPWCRIEISNRISPIFDCSIPVEQDGFRKGHKKKTSAALLSHWSIPILWQSIKCLKSFLPPSFVVNKFNPL